MTDYAQALHDWLNWLDGKIPDDLLAIASIAMLTLVVIAKSLMLLALKVRPSVSLACADFCFLVWSLLAIASKLVVLKTTPQHIVLHVGMAIYAFHNLIQIREAWHKAGSVRGLIDERT